VLETFVQKFIAGLSTAAVAVAGARKEWFRAAIIGPLSSINAYQIEKRFGELERAPPKNHPTPLKNRVQGLASFASFALLI
jgi:hypothetical protein